MSLQILVMCLLFSVRLILADPHTDGLTQLKGQYKNQQDRSAIGGGLDLVPFCVLPERLSNHERHLLESGPEACLMKFPGATEQFTSDNVDSLFDIYTGKSDLDFERFPLKQQLLSVEKVLVPVRLRIGRSPFQTFPITFVSISSNIFKFHRDF